MTNRLQVKDHLRNGALYWPAAEPSPGGEWKRRLFRQHALCQQLQDALREKSRLPKLLVCIGVPVLCIAFAVVAYLELIHPEHWFDIIVPVVNFEMPPIGLKECLILIVIINGLTLLIRKRAYLLG
jgi:hypothetical protein